MAYKLKGAARNGGGRPPGSKNVRKNTHVKEVAKAIPDLIEGDNNRELKEKEEFDMRESIYSLLVKQIPKLSGLIDRIAVDDPKGAATLIRDLTEFVQPKVMRTDSKIDGGSPVNVKFESYNEFVARTTKEMNELTITKATPDDFAKSN